MVERSSGDVIAFNGEIYGFKDLREALRREGERFESSGDTEVLLRALSRRGPGVLPALRGMFAIAFWDASRRTLLLARDPLGIKPLYLARNPDPHGEWAVAFSSEVRALLESGLLPARRLDPRAIASVVWNGFVVGPTTIAAGVTSVSPGEAIEVDLAGATSATDFWRIPPPGSSAPVSEEEVSRILEETVELHLTSDVPLAVFLSAGVDSSAVANLAQRASAEPIHTFTLSFEESAYDEGPSARRIAEAIGTRHTEVKLTEDRFRSILEEALDGLDQPSFDGLNSFAMSMAVRDAGFRVALVGTGGDELFGGYPTFRLLPAFHRMARRSKWAPGQLLEVGASIVTAPLRRTVHSIPPQTRWAKLPELVRRRDDLLSLYQVSYALFLPDFQRDLLAQEADGAVEFGLPTPTRARLEAEIAGRTPLSAVGVLEQRLFLGERLLRDNDSVSMAISVEQRVPLVDHVLLDAVCRLTDANRFEPLGTKAILRRIGLRGLDPALFDRPKTGFVLPFDRWIRRGLKKQMDEAMLDPMAVAAAGLRPAAVERLWRAFLTGAPGVYWSRVWALYSLIRWCDRYGVRA